MKIILLYLVLVAGTTSVPGHADDFNRAEIIQLVKAGKILSLEAMLAHYPEKEYGKLLDLEVEKKYGSIIYELEFLTADGRVLELKVDAANGRLLERELE